MTAAIQAEFRKFFSTRQWWVLLIAMVCYVAFLAAVMAWGFHYAGSGALDDGGGGPDAEHLPAALLAQMVYTIGNSLAYVFPALVGALAVTNEYRHQTLTPTFLAEPRRGVVLGAKLLAALPMGLAFALACQLTAVAVGGAVFGATGFPTALGLAHTWALLARGLVAMTLWTVVGVGYGTLLHNQLAAILVLVGFTQFIEPVLRMIPTLLNTDWPVLRYLPGAASDAVVGTSFYNVSFYAGRAASGLANPWVGAVTLIGYGVVLGAIGYWASLRKDVT